MRKWKKSDKLQFEFYVFSPLCFTFTFYMQEVFLSGVDDDLKSLCTKILKSSKDGNSLLGSDEEVGVK